MKLVGAASNELSPREQNALSAFFESKIASQSVLDVATKSFKKLISDRSIHEKLRNRIIEGFLLASNSVRYVIIYMILELL
jgi:hypothetical protein